MHYILDENKNPIPEPDLIKWAVWYERSEEQCRVGDDSLPFGTDEIRVSTVFLSLAHISNNFHKTDTQPMLYETMVFGPDAVIKRLVEMSEMETRSILAQMFGDFDIQQRYATRQEAEQGHKTMVQFVAVCLAQMEAP